MHAAAAWGALDCAGLHFAIHAILCAARVHAHAHLDDVRPAAERTRAGAAAPDAAAALDAGFDVF